jgi:N-acetylneuraminic acid mutarotase
MRTMSRVGYSIAPAMLCCVLHELPLARSADGSWTREPDMPTARAAHAAAATADAIYVLAGTGQDGKPVLAIERFDGTAWSREGVLPDEGLNAPAAAVLGESIYLIGGFGTTTNRPTTAVHRYDTRRRAWSAAASLPAPRGGHAAVVLNGRIHVIGGGNAVSTIDDHTVYDPQTDTWAERAKLPRSMGSPAAVVLDGKLYSIGGRSGRSDFGDVHIYDPATNAWSTGVRIDARGTGGAAVVGGAILYFGGESQAKSVVLGDVLRLDPGASAWVADTPMPTARNFARTVPFKGRVYVIGGSTVYGSSHASIGSTAVESYRR